MTAQTNGSLVLSITFAVIGVILLVGGAALLVTDLPVAGYGIWIFVWGLAFLIGAFSRYPVRQT